MKNHNIANNSTTTKASQKRIHTYLESLKLKTNYVGLKKFKNTAIFLNKIGLYHPLDGDTNLKYRLLCFLTPNKKISKRKAPAFNWDRCCHLALCLRLFAADSLLLATDFYRQKSYLLGEICPLQNSSCWPKYYFAFHYKIFNHDIWKQWVEWRLWKYTKKYKSTS